MKKEDFSSESPGRLVSTVDGVLAFVPGPLPEKLLWTQKLTSILADATMQLGRLDSLGSFLPNPHLLISPFLRREAVLSSRIEGTQASVSDVFRSTVDEQVERDVFDVREVLNYVEAMDYGLKRLEELPLRARSKITCSISPTWS